LSSGLIIFCFNVKDILFVRTKKNLKSYFSGGIGGLLSKLGRFTAKRLEQKGSKRRGKKHDGYGVRILYGRLGRARKYAREADGV